MAMGEARTGSETLQVQMVCLDELVAAGGRYRRIAAYQRMRTARGVSATLDRMSDGEGAISELKGCHALHRVRCRGTGRVQIQALLAATAVNLKRLLQHSDAHTATAAGSRQRARIAVHQLETCAPTTIRRLLQRTSQLAATVRRRWPVILAPTTAASLTGS